MRHAIPVYPQVLRASILPVHPESEAYRYDHALARSNHRYLPRLRCPLHTENPQRLFRFAYPAGTGCRFPW